MPSDNGGERHPLRAEIDTLVTLRSDHRRKKEWDAADGVKRRLSEPPYRVEIADYADGSSEWTPIGAAGPERQVAWEALENLDPDGAAAGEKGVPDEGGGCEWDVPVIVATVDAPQYRVRLDGTLPHLRSHGFDPRLCPLLDVRRRPDLGPRRVLSEGWRTVLLLDLLSSSAGGTVALTGGGGVPFVLVAEDDARLVDGADARGIARECAAAFRSDPELDVLSLGHAWSGLSDGDKRLRRRRSSGLRSNGKVECLEEDSAVMLNASLLSHLRSGGGVHGTTLLALRHPAGTARLVSALNDASGSSRGNKQTHFDQFLFRSMRHDLRVALSDPPLVGWSEAEVTLTAAGSGHRRKGGGRRGFVPPPVAADQDCVGWVKRWVVEAPSLEEQT